MWESFRYICETKYKQGYTFSNLNCASLRLCSVARVRYVLRLCGDLLLIDWYLYKAGRRSSIFCFNR